VDYDRIEKIDNGIVLEKIKNFELNHTFDCGQCFRWNETEKGNYIGVAFGKVVEIEKVDDDLKIYNTTEEEFYSIWRKYLDLERNYSDIKEELSKDPLLKKSVDFGHGLRILNQDTFEITLSFITSANNRIPMIKRAIENMSKKFGEPLEYKGNTYYSFPTVESLKEANLEEIESCGMGFRAKYIKDTVDKIYEAKIDTSKKEFDLDYIKTLDDNESHDAMQIFSGIGPKVADCIILFSMEKQSAFPVDVWVKRAMQHFYVAPDVSLKKIRDFGREKFGDLAGVAQQYLFYYARENNIKV
jgi:N-glycosylase/DNA lyase